MSFVFCTFTPASPRCPSVERPGKRPPGGDSGGEADFFELNENYDGLQLTERKERIDFRRAQRAVDRLEGGGTRRGGGCRDRPHEYRRVDPHGNDRPAGREVPYDRRAGRRHERGGSGEPDGQDDGAFRRQVRLHAPLDRHVAQRPQGPHLRRSGLRLPLQDARHFGHLVPQGHPGGPQEGRHQRLGFDRGALVYRRAAHALRLQRHGRRQGPAGVDRPQLRLYLRPGEARAHQHRLAVADADHGRQRRAGAGRPDVVRREHVAAGQRLGRGLRRLRADALLGPHAQGDDAEPLPRRRILVDGHVAPRDEDLREGHAVRRRAPEPIPSEREEARNSFRAGRRSGKSLSRKTG